MILTLLFLPALALAQQPPSTASVESLTVTGTVPTDRFIDRHTALEFSLSRPLLPDEGTIAIMIGSVDVSDLLELGATRVTYRPLLTPLPAGERDVIVYRHAKGRWVELQRFALKVLRRDGLVRVALSPSATLGNNGQLAERGDLVGGAPAARSTFQDFTLTSGFRTAHEGASWALETQSNVVGASRQEQALQFAQRGADAPRVDLSDYLVTFRARRTRLALGHVSMGTNRHLVSGFGSRGVTITTDVGPATLSFGATNGTSIVGWNHLVGLDNRDHRVMSAALGSELVPSRPGTLRVDLSLLDGSLLPQTSFTQGAAVDAEHSRGVGVQVSAATPDQRIRLSGGYARSQFTNPPRDAELFGDSVMRPVRPETRGARYVDVSLAVLQGARMPGVGNVTLNTGYRHERVDPLYRSVAVSTQADQQQHAFDVSGSAGSLSGQLSLIRSHDNLDEIPSVLRSLNRQATASLTLALPTIARLRRIASFLPTLAYATGRTHQMAAGTPTNGDFRPTDLPDQVSTSQNADAQWAAGRWRLSYRFTANEQDNRQALRELADFSATTHGLTIGFAFGTTVDLSADASAERQHAKERDEVSNVRRIGLAMNWRPLQATAIVASMNAVTSHDASRPKGSRNNDTRLELSQGLFQSGGASRAQLFLRYALTSVFLPVLGVSDPSLSARPWQRHWTLSSGFSLKLF
jgi:hypothetical protein